MREAQTNHTTLPAESCCARLHTRTIDDDNDDDSVYTTTRGPIKSASERNIYTSRHIFIHTAQNLFDSQNRCTTITSAGLSKCHTHTHSCTTRHMNESACSAETNGLSAVYVCVCCVYNITFACILSVCMCGCVLSRTRFRPSTI